MQIVEYLKSLKPAFYILLTVSGCVLNYVITTINSDHIKNEVREVRAETVHSRIDGFAGTLSAFRDEAYRLERINRENENRIELLIECTKRGDCKKYPQLLKPIEKTQVNISESYQPIRELLGKTYKEEK